MGQRLPKKWSFKKSLPSRDIPTAMHFLSLQYWHRLRLMRRMAHCWFLVQGRYCIFCWMLRRKKPCEREGHSGCWHSSALSHPLLLLLFSCSLSQQAICFGLQSLSVLAQPSNGVALLDKTSGALQVSTAIILNTLRRITHPTTGEHLHNLRLEFKTKLFALTGRFVCHCCIVPERSRAQHTTKGRIWRELWSARDALQECTEPADEVATTGRSRLLRLCACVGVSAARESSVRGVTHFWVVQPVRWTRPEPGARTPTHTPNQQLVRETERRIDSTLHTPVEAVSSRRESESLYNKITHKKPPIYQIYGEVLEIKLIKFTPNDSLNLFNIRALLKWLLFVCM